MNTTKLIAAGIVFSLILAPVAPTISFAKARGGGGGYSGGGTRSGGNAGSFGSRGSRTYDRNSAKPIEQSTTPKPSTGPPQSAAQPQAPQPAPAAQPSFLQRHPLLSGIAAGIAGSWIGHMIFGAAETSAKTDESGDQSGASTQTAGGSNFTGILFLMLLGGGVLYYLFLRNRRPIPVLTGPHRREAVTGSLMAAGSSRISVAAAEEDEITSADKATFQQLLEDVQTAWGRQDLASLRRSVTPEMLSYFSTALAEQASQDLANHMEDIALLRAEVLESWTEDAVQYATVSLNWSARDYTVSLTKQPGQAGYLVEGSLDHPTETTEAWTFMRHLNGKWLLSAIQQVQ
ncbi:membrane protein [Nitrospira sp. KM1]|uniref:Tim44 domain-containing protein n=1 Tax=Nitrospira sp. KM1 TaxID=1936990 RepID=UPI0013A7456A|nr:TIM44-like domain-containing protein [Nitrospira sp. KM1]BCA56489.1 membrane protein [Nitrospira sp. KM1]